MNAYYTNSDGELISGRGKCDMFTCDNFYNMTDKSQVKLQKNGANSLFFYLLPATPPDYDGYRRVIISLYGEAAKKGEAKSIYQLQATVSQRNL
jgi:hypothetical protein